MQLSIDKKLNTIDILFSFLQHVNKKGYVAIGSFLLGFTAFIVT